MSIDELDDKTREIILQLAAARGCTVEELARAVLSPASQTGTNGDPILGLFADDAELIDQLLESAYQGRELASSAAALG